MPKGWNKWRLENAADLYLPVLPIIVLGIVTVGCLLLCCLEYLDRLLIMVARVGAFYSFGLLFFKSIVYRFVERKTTHSYIT